MCGRCHQPAHGGWRFQALKEAVEVAKPRGSNIEIEVAHIYRGKRPSGVKSPFHEELLRIAKETGTTLKESVSNFKIIIK